MKYRAKEKLTTPHGTNSSTVSITCTKPKTLYCPASSKKSKQSTVNSTNVAKNGSAAMACTHLSISARTTRTNQQQHAPVEYSHAFRKYLGGTWPAVLDKGKQERSISSSEINVTKMRLILIARALHHMALISLQSDGVAWKPLLGSIGFSQCSGCRYFGRVHFGMNRHITACVELHLDGYTIHVNVFIERSTSTSRAMNCSHEIHLHAQLAHGESALSSSVGTLVQGVHACVVVGYSVLFMSAYQMCHLWLKLPRPCMPVLWLFLAPIYYSAHWNHLAHQ